MAFDITGGFGGRGPLLPDPAAGLGGNPQPGQYVPAPPTPDYLTQLALALMAGKMRNRGSEKQRRPRPNLPQAGPRFLGPPQRRPLLAMLAQHAQ